MAKGTMLKSLSELSKSQFAFVEEKNLKQELDSEKTKKKQ